MSATTIKHEQFSRKLSSFDEIKGIEPAETENTISTTNAGKKQSHRTYDDGFEYKRYEISQQTDIVELASA